MTNERDHRTDAGVLERRLSRLLTAATLAAAGVLLAGLVVGWVGARDEGAQAGARYAAFVPAAPRTAADLWAGLRRGDAGAIMAAGVVLLVLTPVARVAFTLAAFAAGRSWTYVVLSGVVLAALVAGLLGVGG